MKEDLVKVLVNLPQYILMYIVGLFIAICDDFFMTTLTIAAVLGGFVFHSILVGLFIFFVIYAVMRLVDSQSGAVITASNTIGSAIYNKPSQPVTVTAPSPPQP